MTKQTDTLEFLYHQGYIHGEEYIAGCRFRELYYLAQQSEGHAIMYGTERVDGGKTFEQSTRLVIYRLQLAKLYKVLEPFCKLEKKQNAREILIKVCVENWSTRKIQDVLHIREVHLLFKLRSMLMLIYNYLYNKHYYLQEYTAEEIKKYLKMCSYKIDNIVL